MSKFIGVKMIEDPAGDVLKEDDIKRFIIGFVLQWAKYGLKK